jgi:hypothetical protein
MVEKGKKSMSVVSAEARTAAFYPPSMLLCVERSLQQIVLYKYFSKQY